MSTHRRRTRKRKPKPSKSFSGEKLRREGFTIEGIRTDTKVMKKFRASNGYEYQKRKNGTYYPKHSSISVTQPTREIYAIFNRAKLLNGYRFRNYDELLIRIAECLLKKKPEIEFSLSPSQLRELERRIKIAKTHIRMMRKARVKAKEKIRLNPRKASWKKKETQFKNLWEVYEESKEEEP